MERIPEERKRYLDGMFHALSIVADGTYVFLTDMEYGMSKWSKTAVDYFDLPGEYMDHGDEIWGERIHPDDRECYRKSMEAIFAGMDEEHDMQYRAMNREGKYVICTCRGSVLRCPDTGKGTYLLGTIKNHGQIGNIDQLTGLPNQYGFFSNLQLLLSKQEKVSLAMFGVDHFSNINDVYGYDFGNKVLVRFARTVMEHARNLGSIYRLDGIRFAIISHLDREEILERYERLRNWAIKGIDVEGKKIYLHCNASFLALDDFDISDKTIFSCLNYAYEISKEDKQGDLIEFFNNLSAGNNRRIQKINAIRDSVTDNCKGFTLFYQPIVWADTGKLKGAEALIRWKNDNYGMVFPDSFIDVLETDSIYPVLGDWILETAMTQGKKILETYPDFIMNINISYTQMEKSGFSDVVLELLEKTGFPPQNLCLELTERCRLLDLRVIRSIITKLRVNGVKFALDDFGTGYSSTYMIKALPLDTIKIDRSFVRNVLEDRREQELVKYFVDIAGLFGSDVCVEGIENEQMEEIVRQYPVKSLQGYHYAKPIPFEEFTTKYIDLDKED